MNNLINQKALYNFNPKFKKFDICNKFKFNLNGEYSEENPNESELVIIDEVRVDVNDGKVLANYSIRSLKKLSGSWYNENFLEFVRKADEKDLELFY